MLKLICCFVRSGSCYRCGLSSTHFEGLVFLPRETVLVFGYRESFPCQQAVHPGAIGPTELQTQNIHSVMPAGLSTWISGGGETFFLTQNLGEFNHNNDT